MGLCKRHSAIHYRQALSCNAALKHGASAGLRMSLQHREQEPHHCARRVAVHRPRRGLASHRAAWNSHLSLALAVEAVKAGRSVYFGSLADIIGALAKAEREGVLREKIRFFCRFALLIVDEIGYLPVIPGGGNFFFQLVKPVTKGAL